MSKLARNHSRDELKEIIEETYNRSIHYSSDLINQVNSLFYEVKVLINSLRMQYRHHYVCSTEKIYFEDSYNSEANVSKFLENIEKYIILSIGRL